MSVCVPGVYIGFLIQYFDFFGETGKAINFKSTAINSRIDYFGPNFF